MVHPCRTGNPGTVLHACTSPSSEKTLCGLEIQTSEINVTAGYDRVCRKCFPKDQGNADEGSRIEDP